MADATEAALVTLHKIDVVQTKALRIFCVYEDINIIKRLLQQYANRYDEIIRDGGVCCTYSSPRRMNSVVAVTNATSARAGTSEAHFAEGVRA